MLEQGREVLTARMTTGAMAPRYEIGEELFVDPSVAPEVGDDAYVETERGGFILEMIASNQDEVRFRQCAPAREITFERTQISRLCRVIPRSEWLN